ncbi:MAG TPA: hypothetical protein VLJ10_04400 [Candidatus Bathyarchaeia archaeon]|nr:hypothetical protein [Candidatus Bathyarchaeia archaeon]
MMKKFFSAGCLALVVAMVSGCALTYEQYEIVQDPDPVLRRFISTSQLHEGLSPSEAKALLGDQVVIGYELSDRQAQYYKPLTLQNPYRSESYQAGNKTFLIEYYVMGINQSDDQITDDELTPLIYEQDRLTGWGWDFLRRYVKKDKA